MGKPSEKFILIKVNSTAPFIDEQNPLNNGMHIRGDMLITNYKLNQFENSNRKISLTIYPHIRYEIVKNVDEVLDEVMVDRL